MNFCSQCGARVQQAALYCSSCGTALRSEQTSLPSEERDAPDPEPLVKLSRSSRRGLVGSIDPKTAGPEITEDMWFHPDSEEVRFADLPFDPSRIPGPEDHVPHDCVWIFVPYPGKPLGPPVGGKLKDRMASLGWVLSGRPMSEVVAYLGDPVQVVHNDDGIPGGIWADSGFFSPLRLRLDFDRYGICFGFDNLSG